MYKIHFLNLTNGLLCRSLHLFDDEQSVHLIRLQSTWVEQKRWPDMLWTLGADFYSHLATSYENEITVHDVSERERVTKACHTGLVGVRYICERLWDVPRELRHPVLSRSGSSMEYYFSGVLHGLDDRLIKYLKYYKKFYEAELPVPLKINICPGTYELAFELNPIKK